MGHLYYPEVDLRGEASVQLHLLLAVEAPLLQGTEIEVAEIDGFLDLVGEVTNEENEGYLSLHQIDVPGILRIGVSLQQ